MKNIFYILNSVSILFIIGCSTDPAVDDPAVEEATPQDIEDAQILSTAGISELSNEMNNLYQLDCEEDPQDCMEEIDFSVSNGYFEDALELNPEDPDANFGGAITELMLITQDESFSDAVDDWINYFESVEDQANTNNISQLTDNNFLNLNGFNLGFPHSVDAFNSFNQLNILNLYSPEFVFQSLNKNNDPPPELSDMQDIIHDVIVTRVDIAIARMDKIIQKDYTFIISGDMQGDEYQDPLEMDDTEFYLMKALLHSISAFGHMIIAYNVDVPYYDVVDDLFDENENPLNDYDWLNQDSEFLTLRDGHQNDWNIAYNNIYSVYECLNGAWNYGMNEIDPQVDDIIPIKDEIDNDPDFYHEVEDMLTEMNSVLTGPYDIEFCSEYAEYYYSYYGEYENECVEESTLKIDVREFLTNPRPNLKTLIPDYIVHPKEEEIWDSEWFDDYHNYSYNGYDDCQNENVNYYIYFDYNEDTGSIESQNYGDNIPPQALIDNIIETIFTPYTEMGYDEIDYFSFYIYYTGNDCYINDSINVEAELYNINYVNIPVLCFEASSLDEWKNGFDHTVNGLFPEMDINQFIENFMGMDLDEQNEFWQEYTEYAEEECSGLNQ